MFVYEGFDPIDVFGPYHVLGALRTRFSVRLLGPTHDPISSSIGAAVVPDATWDTEASLEVVMVPGGQGARTAVGDARLLDAVRRHADTAELVTSVCTGAAILAAAGLLDGRRATSNKLAWEWVVSCGAMTKWVPEARWVTDGNVLTSGGVAAGIDMSLAIVARYHGDELARRLADGIEYEWHADPDRDPFARKAGLVDRS
jgi:putative intracellular protease/amidase